MAERKVNIQNPNFNKNEKKIYFLFDYLFIINNWLKYDFQINGSHICYYNIIFL